MVLKSKRKGFGLEFKTIDGKDKQKYLVFKGKDGSFHTFVETEAKEAARQCGNPRGATTREMWKSIWKK